MELDLINNPALCRICIKETISLMSIYSVVQIVNANINDDKKIVNACDDNEYIENDSVKIVDMLLKCFPIVQIKPDDELPKQICLECVEKLNVTFEFWKLIEQSEQIFQKLRYVEVPIQSIENTTNQNLKDEKDDNGCDMETDSDSRRVPSASEKIDFKIEKTETVLIDANRSEEQYVPFDIAEEPNVSSDCNKTLRISIEPALHESSEHKNRCVVCRKTFRGKCKYNSHLINKHDVRSDHNVFKPHQCDKCEKAYTSLANLNIHKATHTGIKPFKCNICERAFYKELSLTNHLAVHTGLRKYPCQKCDRSFTSANILQQHMVTHSSNRMYKCSKCPRDFFKANDLRVHFRTHTGERPFLCSTCGRKFSRKTHLNTHLRVHSGEKPYKCQTCDKSFAQSGDLTAHVRIHTGERPYVCSICEKSFNQSSGLRSHMKSHTGERNYICCICTKGFTQSSSLGRHIKIHSK